MKEKEVWLTLIGLSLALFLYASGATGLSILFIGLFLGTALGIHSERTKNKK